MNISFILTGGLLLLGLFLTRSTWPRRRLTIWGLGFLILAGVGKIVVGLAPENANLILHLLGSLGIPCASIGMLLLGFATLGTRRWVALFSLALGALGLLGLLLGNLVVAALGHGRGAAERVADYPVVVWMIVLGICFVWVSRSSMTLDS
jgi:hypothetical membrane protein